MRISRIESRIVRLPADEPLAGGPTSAGATRDFVALRVRTDDGPDGVGATFFGGALTGALKTAVDSLGALTIGEDPLRVEAIADKLRVAAGSSGPGGIFTLALAAIDIALWDIKGKAFNVPVARLAGGHRERVPTYASGALMRTFPLDHVVHAAASLVTQGFRQMKTQLALPGDTTPAREVDRIRRIREAIGPDIDLMCDINQRWDARQAIAIGARLEEYHLYWLEDVVAAEDYPGLAAVSAALATPIAAGEYLYGKVPFRHLLEARAVDIVMIDVLRAGGITQWLKIAGMAEAFNLPVVNHLCPEISVHLVSAMPNGLTVEYMPWSAHLYKAVPQPVNGMLSVPERPGLGLEFDEGALRRYGVD
ncbi:MAG TPA: mandelate racemase/muconate lactonizing enzyme family protein [Burkholderiales bacterium]|jgi:L-alanine-DL-glutamate epimerase-like enolase superfamily enzyme|nr:mandelate racemase/muconate lactonizing enzyme family protein [Burkholderiales bacterium]